MNEVSLTLIIAISLFVLLLLVSLAKIFIKNDNDKHLNTYDEDFDLYFYKLKKDNTVISKPKLDTEIQYINREIDIDEDFELEKYSKQDLANDESWIKMRTSFRKEFILHKIKEIQTSSYKNYFIIKDLSNNKIIKERWLNSDNEEENIKTIKRFMSSGGGYEILYIGSFGFISNRITDVFDLR